MFRPVDHHTTSRENIGEGATWGGEVDDHPSRVYDISAQLVETQRLLLLATECLSLSQHL